MARTLTQPSAINSSCTFTIIEGQTHIAIIKGNVLEIYQVMECEKVKKKDIMK
jgi:hypothetical protein